MKTLSIPTLIPMAFAVACASPAGPSAKPVTEPAAGGTPSAVADGSGTEVGVKTDRTGDKGGLETWTNINYSKDKPMTESLVHIDEKMAEQCDLDGTSVYFVYDSANVSPMAKDNLQGLASCLKKAEMKDIEVSVIGFADPRGTDEYNVELGMSRAQSVTQVLRDAGVASDRLTTVSHGESTSLDKPELWPIARRVEINLES